MAEEQVVSPETAQKVDPATQKQMQSYIMGLSHLVHGKETRTQVMNVLSSGDPQDTVPQAALMVNDQMQQAVTSKGKPPSFDVLTGAAQFLVGDLIELGNSAGYFKVDTPEQVAPILKSTMQQYIERGLKDGSIDPIELQKKVEPMMNEEHRQLGLEAASRSGIPQTPDQTTAMEVYARQRMQKGMLKGGQK